jgi:hypothetical protein
MPARARFICTPGRPHEFVRMTPPLAATRRAGIAGRRRARRGGAPTRAIAGWARRGTLCAALALAALAAGCSRRDTSGPPIEIAMRVHPDPPVVGTETIELDLREVSGAAVRGATVKIEGDMAHPGMAPSFAEAHETKPGTYRADLELTMAGDWTVLVEARLADGQVVRRPLSLLGVQGR